MEQKNGECLVEAAVRGVIIYFEDIVEVISSDFDASTGVGQMC